MMSFAIAAAVVLSAASCILAVDDVPRPSMKATSYPGQNLVYYDDFNKFQLNKWSHESTLGGGGNWEFEWYT